jgi:hypothetical protein
VVKRFVQNAILDQGSVGLNRAKLRARRYNERIPSSRLTALFVGHKLVYGEHKDSSERGKRGEIRPIIETRGARSQGS